MGTNLTIESPNFDKIDAEAGQFTSSAIYLIWAALNDTRASERRDFRLASERLEPKVLTLAPSGSVNDQDLDGASVVSFTGGTAQNLTGFRAPETNHTRLVFLQVSGAGTITVRNNLTSETANQIVTSTGADVTRATNQGMVLAYLASKWRQVA